VNVIVTGPESSGTRFVSRWLEAHPDVVARHWSMPSGERWMRHWPTDHDFDAAHPDALVFVIRDVAATVESQLDREMVTCRNEAWCNITQAHLRAFAWAVSHGVPVYPLIYDSVVEHPERMGHLFRWLGLDAVEAPEPVVDANERRLA
jgi:hypothetical protein